MEILKEASFSGVKFYICKSMWDSFILLADVEDLAGVGTVKGLDMLDKLIGSPCLGPTWSGPIKKIAGDRWLLGFSFTERTSVEDVEARADCLSGILIAAKMELDLDGSV